jgi:hypothetical protein
MAAVIHDMCTRACSWLVPGMCDAVRESSVTKGNRPASTMLNSTVRLGSCKRANCPLAAAAPRPPAHYCIAGNESLNWSGNGEACALLHHLAEVLQVSNHLYNTRAGATPGSCWCRSGGWRSSAGEAGRCNMCAQVNIGHDSRLQPADDGYI